MKKISLSKTSIYMILVVGLSLSCYMAFQAYQYEKKEADAEFKKNSLERVLMIEDKLADSLSIFQEINAFYKASTFVSEEEFKLFVADYLKRTPSLDFLAWAPRITFAEKIDFEKESGFAIKPIDEPSKDRLSIKRSEYFPISYLASLERVKIFQGTDLFSTLDLEYAIKQAVESDASVLSPFSSLSRDKSNEGFLILRPLHEKEASLKTNDQRWQGIKGLVVASYDISRLVEDAFVGLPHAGIHVAIFDISTSHNPELIHYHVSRSLGMGNKLQELPTIESLTKNHHHSKTIEYGSRKLKIVCTPAYRLWGPFQFREPWVMLFMGSFLAIMMFLLLRAYSKSSNYIEKQVKLRTAELSKARGNLLEEIKDRKNAEKRLKLFIENSPAAVAMFDTKMRYMLTSRKWIDIFNLNSSIIGKSHYDVFPEIKKTMPHWIRDHQECLKGTCRKGEEAFVRANGDKEWLKWEVHPWFLKGSTVGGLIMYSEVITAEKEAEKRLKQQDEMLQQSQKLEALGRLSGGVAHDFNNSLTVIKGFGYFLKDALKNMEKEQKYVDEILIASEKAARLTDQLLSFSRKQVQQAEPVDMVVAFSHFEELLKRLIGAEYILRLHFNADHAWCEIEQNQFEQVIMNLAVNARDSMPEGGIIAISVGIDSFSKKYLELHKDLNEGEYVKISVSDSGTGISEEVLKHVFEPFFTTKEKGKGTGLGLATSFGIVKQNNGHMTVKTGVGIGSVFSIYLPRIKANKNEKIVKKHEIQKILPAGDATVLLCEDESALRYVAKEILTKQGYKVIEASDGQEGWEKMQENSEVVDIVISDVIMPRMGGKDLLENLKTTFPDLPVLLMSGYADDYIGVKDLVVEHIGFMRKPFRAEDFLLKVYELLKMSKRGGK